MASYCGILALYAALRLVNCPASLDDLALPEYVSTSKGSTFADLIRAANSHGVVATPAKNLDISFVLRQQTPTILHVRSTMATKEFDHYVLAIGKFEDGILAIDPGQGLVHISRADLDWLWDETGIFLSTQPIRFSSVGRYIFVIVLIAAIVAFIGRRTSRKREMSSPFSVSSYERVAILCLTGIAVGVAANALTFNGLLRVPPLVRVVQEIHLAKFLPTVSSARLASRLRDKRPPILIDARLSGDFKAGHIESAINIPTSFDENRIAQELGNYDRSFPIVVYCQSKSCEFDEIVARKLVSLGFTDVSLYTDGWVQWIQTQASRRDKN